MPRESFDAQLEELQGTLLKMGSRVEEAIQTVVRALVERDPALAQTVVEGDDEIDRLQHQVERQAFQLIALQQPLAGDLRHIVSAIKISGDLERIGDNCENIARVIIRLGGQAYVKPLIDVPRMGELARSMLRDTLEAYVSRDVEALRTLPERDDEVDHLYSQVLRELLTYMMQDPQTIQQGMELLLVSRYLERIADHVTNVGEAVIYLVTGEHTALNA
ncbi:MAG: phosphate signaling complex protein PhoU [Clostridia bacterium]|nr:phosphate signaling complex protein PhoU [Clostridia bacterium]